MRYAVFLLLALSMSCALLPRPAAAPERHRVVVPNTANDLDLLCVERTPAMVFDDPNIVGIICIETIGQLRARVNREQQAN